MVALCVDQLQAQRTGQTIFGDRVHLPDIESGEFGAFYFQAQRGRRNLIDAFRE